MLLVGLNCVFSQKPVFKTFYGEMVHDSLDVSGIHVINKTSGATTITNSKGKFKVGAKQNDTLIFSAVQIKLQSLILTKEIFEQEEVKIYVEPFVNQLTEVVVKPHDLSGDLTADVQNSDVTLPLNFHDVGIPGFRGEREEVIAPAIPYFGLGIAVDVEALYKHLSGYYKSLKKKRKLDKKYLVISDLISFYGVVYLMEVYSISEDQVYQFVLGACENSSIQRDFIAKDHALVISALDTYYQNDYQPN